MVMISRIAPVLIIVSSVFTTDLVHGEEADWHEHGSPYEQARAAVRRGQALPLPQIRAHLDQVAPGKIVATHYEFEFDRWVYEFKIVDPQGRLRKVHLDALTGELVKVSDY
jgi:uncharacterized membrane protein YkoI